LEWREKFRDVLTSDTGDTETQEQFEQEVPYHMIAAAVLDRQEQVVYNLPQEVQRNSHNCNHTREWLRLEDVQ